MRQITPKRVIGSVAVKKQKKTSDMMNSITKNVPTRQVAPKRVTGSAAKKQSSSTKRPNRSFISRKMR